MIKQCKYYIHTYLCEKHVPGEQAQVVNSDLLLFLWMDYLYICFMLVINYVPKLLYY